MPGSAARAAPGDEEAVLAAPLVAAHAPEHVATLQRRQQQQQHAIATALVVVGALVVGVAVGRRSSPPLSSSSLLASSSSNPPNIPPECVTALGGGVMGPGGSVKMDWARVSADGGQSCRSALAAYAAQPGGAYWRDVEAAVGAAYAALGISADEEAGAGEAGATPAPRGVVVFDIDETALSNTPLSSPASASSSPSSPSRSSSPSDAAPLFPTALFSADGARLPSSSVPRDGDGPSPALVPTLRLYNALQRQGLAAAFVTGRGEAARAETESNLLAAGYGGRCGDGGDKQGAGGASSPCFLSLTLRQPGDARPASVYKPEARRAAAAAAGLPVVGSVGDQWSDICGELRGEGGAGEADSAPYVAIKLPNPFYYIL